MPNLSALEPLTTKATALSGLVLITPSSTRGYQAQNKPDANGKPSTAQQEPTLLFHYEGEQVSQLESDITDHWVEDNTAIQDQIALKAEIITASGFIGELNNVPPVALRPLRVASDKLVAIQAYQPQLSVSAQQAYNQAFYLYQVAETSVNSAVSAWSSLVDLVTGADAQNVINESGITKARIQNKQQEMFQQFYGYWRNRTLFTVQTPWAVFQNMAILNLRAIQEENTRVITNFQVSFKMIRKAETIEGNALIQGVSSLFQNRANPQASPLTDQGTSVPSPSSSLADGISSILA